MGGAVGRAVGLEVTRAVGFGVVAVATSGDELGARAGVGALEAVPSGSGPGVDNSGDTEAACDDGPEYGKGVAGTSDVEALHAASPTVAASDKMIRPRGLRGLFTHLLLTLGSPRRQVRCGPPDKGAWRPSGPQ